MYKKAAIIMLIGFLVMVFSAGIIFVKFDEISKVLYEIGEGDGEMITKNINIGDSKTLVVDTSNDRINFVKTTDDIIEISYKENKNRKYDLENIDGVITLKKQRKIQILNFDIGFLFDNVVTEVRIPEKLIENITIINSNAEIKLENFDFAKLNLSTTNARIVLNNINILNDISLKTSNASIEINNTTGNEVIANTSNGKVMLSNVTLKDLDLQTSNASVDISESNILDKVLVKSSNGKIEVDNINSKYIDLITSNSQIVANVLAKENEYNQEYKTSNAKIEINGKITNEKYINNTYNEAYKKINAKTSNGKITINFEN